MATRTKLTGRAFYESIGSPKVVLAPMVDQSEFAWRMLTRSFMPQSGSEESKSLLSYTPMLHSRLYRADPKYRRRMFEPTRQNSTLELKTKKPTDTTADSEKAQDSSDALFLDGNPAIDRPLTVQFCSNDAQDFLEAARQVAPYCDAVDLNLGCPQGIARKGHYGAFLQEDWDKIHSMISTLNKSLEVPVTAKMRILDTKEKTLEYARMILDAGASILTVHGRRREQKGHITGVADWNMLRYLRDNLPAETVLFANGNILQHEDIQQCLDITGFDAVMSAEGNLCDPSVLAPPPPADAKTRDYWRGRDGKGGYRMDAVLRRYLDIIYRYALEVEPPQRKPLFLPGDSDPPQPSNPSSDAPSKKRAHDSHDAESTSEPPSKKQKQDPSQSKQPKTSSPNLLAMRPHLFSMLKPLVAKHTHVRDALAKARPGDMEAFEHVLQLIETVTAEALIEYANGNEDVAKHAEKKPKKQQQPADDPGQPEPGQPEPGQPEPSQPLEDDQIETSMAAVKRCWRPWWICQPNVRPLPAEALAKGSITLGKKVKQQIRRDEGLARDVGVEPRGSSKMVRTEGEGKVEVPKDGLVCG